jgi:hypothetical protein
VRVGVAGFLTREANVRRACLLLLLMAGPAWAAPPKVPEAVPASPGEVVTFEVTVEKGKELGWQTTFGPKSCLLVRLYSDDPAVYSFLAQPKASGSFGVAFWTVGEKKGSTVTIGGGPTPPQPPGPGPAPPGPTPPGPSPDPALVAALTAAYRAEIATDPDGRMLAFLAGAMDKTAEAVAAAETNAALIAASKKLTAEAVGPALAGTRAAVGKHLNATLPGGVVTLTADNRPQFVAAYKAVAAALRGVQR